MKQISLLDLNSTLENNKILKIIEKILNKEQMQHEWQDVKKVRGKFLVTTYLLCGWVHRKHASRLQVVFILSQGSGQGGSFLIRKMYWLISFLLGLSNY